MHGRDTHADVQVAVRLLQCLFLSQADLGGRRDTVLHAVEPGDVIQDCDAVLRVWTIPQKVPSGRLWNEYKV